MDSHHAACIQQRSCRRRENVFLAVAGHICLNHLYISIKLHICLFTLPVPRRRMLSVSKAFYVHIIVAEDLFMQSWLSKISVQCCGLIIFNVCHVSVHFRVGHEWFTLQDGFVSCALVREAKQHFCFGP